MNRSCIALTWLLGSLACGLLVVGSATGQIPPTGLDPFPTPADELAVPPPTPDVRPAAADVPREDAPPAGWTTGPLGLLPYDDEYNCDIPSENPAALPEPAISALVIQLELAEELRQLSLNSPAADRRTDSLDHSQQTLPGHSQPTEDGEGADRQADVSPVADDAAGSPTLESLPFRVLGFGPVEIAAWDDVDDELEVVVEKDLSDADRLVGVVLLRGIGQSLIACGHWFSATASALEEGAWDPNQDE